MLPAKKIWPRTVGFDGGDFCGKTRLALDLLSMMRAHGLDPLYVHLPLDSGLSIGFIDSARRYQVPRECLPLLYAMNRTEVLGPLRQWQSESGGRWLVFDRTVWSGIAYASEGPGPEEEYLLALDWNFPDPQVGFYLKRSAERSRELMALSRERSGVNETRAALDLDFALQKKVRGNFERYFAGRRNWRTINVDWPQESLHEEDLVIPGGSGEFSQRDWEMLVSARVWAIFCFKTDNRLLLPQEPRVEVLTSSGEGILIEHSRAEQLLDQTLRYGVVGERKEAIEKKEDQRARKIVEGTLMPVGPERR